MRALVQRVSQAAVDVEGDRVAQIGPGMLVLLGVGVGDGEEQADRLADKVRALRIFDDAEGRMNEPLGDREILCVSQFTLYGDTSKGNRPSYVQAARPEVAEPLYDRFCERLGAARGRLRRLHGRGPGQRRPGDADPGSLSGPAQPAGGGVAGEVLCPGGVDADGRYLARVRITQVCLWPLWNQQ